MRHRSSHRRSYASVAVFAAVCMLAAGCTSKSSRDNAASNGTGADATSAQGVTADTITISLIASDLSVLSQQHLAPEIGQAKDQAEAVVADINAHGGVAGRKIILKTHVLTGAAAILTPEAGRKACVQATEDDKPFAIIVAAAVTADVVHCTAVEHHVLTITMDSWPKSYYVDSQKGLFSLAAPTSIDVERSYRAWPGILDGIDALKGKTLGIIRMDTADQKEAVDQNLKPAIDALNYKVAAEGVLPCPEGTPQCTQYDAALQRMKDAGVDVVFLVAQTLAGAGTVEAAQKLGYEPQWTTIGQNVTDTVAKFYANGKASYNGALGISSGFTDVSTQGAECNKIVVAGGVKEFPAGSDGYLFTAATCLQIQTLANAIAAVDGAITTASVIGALAGMASVPLSSGPNGSLGADKHDAADFVFISRYSASTQKWVPHDEAKPIKIP